MVRVECFNYIWDVTFEIIKYHFKYNGNEFNSNLVIRSKNKCKRVQFKVDRA